MATTIDNLELVVTLRGSVRVTDAQGEIANQPVNIEYRKNFSSGTGTNQLDVVWQDSSKSLAATPADLDLVGGLTGADGSAISAFVEANVLYIENLSTTDNERVDVGGGGANSVNGTKAGLNSDTDEVLIGPGGLLLLVSPKDGQGIQLVGGTGDILRLDPGASTFNARIFLGGHSS